MRLISSELDRNLEKGYIEPIDINQENIKYFYSYINRLMDIDNLVVLAGSGTSLTFNVRDMEKIAPSMWDLWDACRTHNEKLFQDVIGIVRYSVIQKVKEDSGESKADIELLLSLCDASINTGLHSDENKKKLKDFMEASIKIILDKASFTGKVPLKSWSSHERFINLLARRGSSQERLKLFTTNYDLAFETAASNIGMIVVDGFDFSNPSRFNPMWYKYDVVYRDEKHIGGRNYLSNVMHLYKIHGSVDWKMINGQVQKSNDTNQKPIFIYPSSNKYQSSYDSPYLEMMSALLSALQQPKTGLLVVGFGFNDKHINNAIKMALRTNPEFMMLISTADPFNSTGSFNPEVRDILIESINKGDNRICIVDSFFEEFASKIPQRRNMNKEEELLNAFSLISSSVSKGFQYE
ncbi:SIR2 family protein [Pantoea allii]|uniref:SIR2 family protein n=1 Tax=Pantoea allii TaxID=574096 RepID=UPI0024B74258|nr:SIR2 family protein [Pantoea allii]MDJ0088900.1 SIR2 family protein [Pantoea allii]